MDFHHVSPIISTFLTNAQPEFLLTPRCQGHAVGHLLRRLALHEAHLPTGFPERTGDTGDKNRDFIVIHRDFIIIKSWSIVYMDFMVMKRDLIVIQRDSQE